jgi:hypothetical protein
MEDMKLRLALRKKNKEGTKPLPLRTRLTPFVARAEKKIASKLAETTQKTGTTLTIKVKRPLTPEVSKELGVAKDGTQRGLANRANPPDSEHMRKIRAMRRFYGKQMPVPQCSTCAFSANCPQFKAGHECAFKPFLQSHKVDNIQDLMFYMKELLGSNLQRLHLATIFERLTGGTPSTELSESYAMLFQQLNQLHTLEAESKEITLTTDDTSVIAKLFGSTNSLIDATEKQTHDIQGDLIDIPVEEGASRKELNTAVVNGDLIAEFEKSQERSDPDSAPAPVIVSNKKKAPALSGLLQVSTLKAT